MTTTDPDSERSSFDSGEVMFLLLKHRWKIIICSLAGIIAAAVLYLNHQPPYESQAKLLVRYVVERSPIDTVESRTSGNNIRASDSLIASEVEILNSWDLALEVARVLGTQVILNQPETPATLSAAAATVRRGIVVTTTRGSNVMTVAYRHPDPELAVTVLNQLLTQYFNKHLLVHRSVGAFDFVVEQKEKVAARLKETEDKLNELKSQANVISLTDTSGAINDTLLRAQKDLETAQVEYAEQKARVESLEGLVGRAKESTVPNGPKATQGEIQQYQALVTRLGVLQNESFDLLSRYTPQNRLVRMNREQITRLETQRREMEERYPELVAVGAEAGVSLASRADLLSERASLAALAARIEALQGQLETVQKRAQDLAQYQPMIAELERRRAVEEQNFTYFEATLERARIDEALDPTKIPNISIVQRPSPADTVQAPIHKQMAMLAGGGLVAGLGLVFLFGFVFDRSVKRPSELQRKLGLTHLVAIPYAKRSDLKALTGPAQAALPPGVSMKDPQVMTRARMEQFVQPYCDAICDRLVHYFAMAGKTHKPKLIGITGCHTGAGTSTIAAGLAAALSRTGDGKVLLVDMNPRRSENRYYFGGTHVSSLVELLEPGADKPEPAAENLYLATASPSTNGSSRNVPARFHNLLPRLKHSEFDYIVFDMPPANDTSPTLAMAGFVDKVFLVVEAEKTRRETARRAFEELLGMRADTAILVNKSRSYGPQWMQIEE